jgi:predicted alpha/beta superfamily hydrolase
MKLIKILVLLCFNLTLAQTVYESMESQSLGSTRELKIQLPRNYEDNSEKYYPIVVVFDGDYLFEIVAGNVDYYSYWEDMPEAIVVGINQDDSRSEDCYVSMEDYLPSKTGAQFYDFIENELLNFMSENYRTLNFRVAIGHGETANFINYFLFKDRPVFNSFVALSPTLSYGMQENLTSRLSLETDYKTFYYLSTAALDMKSNNKQIVALNNNISNVENTNLLYGFDNFDDANHYSLVAQSIPKALQSIFLVYQPISKSEYKDHILTLETSPVDYLIEKYDTIETFFGIEKQILVNDFRAIAAAINKTKQFEYYKDLGKIAQKHHPNTVLASFYIARYFEETGKPEKAMNIYRSAYTLEEVAGYTKDDMFERADQIKQEYGF